MKEIELDDMDLRLLDVLQRLGPLLCLILWRPDLHPDVVGVFLVPSGQADGDVAITADRVVESYVEVVMFAPSRWVDEARERELKAWRETLFVAPKAARETSRRLPVGDALALL